MDNFTFVPGNIDEDQTKCLSLMLRSVKRLSLFFCSFHLLNSEAPHVKESRIQQFFFCGFRDPGLKNPEYGSRNPEPTNY